MANENLPAMPDEVIMNKIYVIRGQKVMIDRDLAELYGVKTKALKQAVKRNNKRFPSDFMFEMTEDEFKIWRSQSVTSKSDIMGLRYAPFCFTEEVMSDKKPIFVTWPQKRNPYLTNVSSGM